MEINSTKITIFRSEFVFSSWTCRSSRQLNENVFD